MCEERNLKKKMCNTKECSSMCVMRKGNNRWMEKRGEIETQKDRRGQRTHIKTRHTADEGEAEAADDDNDDDYELALIEKKQKCR